MMRTVEILLVVMIISSAFIVASLFAVLPSPRQVSPINLRRLALTTLQALDVDYDLSATMFKNATDDPSWGQLQIALSACLPPSIVYNLTVYEVQSGQTQFYKPINSISNAESLGVDSDSASYLVASSNVTFSAVPEKIGEHGGGGTLYILNCSDANGWWITGYTAQKLAEDLYNMLSPYFQNTVMLQSTAQLGTILKGTSIRGETLQNAVVINTYGEAVPIPKEYCQGYERQSEGYYSGVAFPYSKFCYTLGQRTRQYNWTWASIVGWPFYYVSNMATLNSSQNGWGIYGMVMVESPGLQAFLQGLDNQPYSYGSSQTGSPGIVYLSTSAQYYCNYYGIYPSPYQTSTRALSSSILSTYHLAVSTYIFNQVNTWIPGAVYRNAVSGGLLAIGLTRTPDIRLTALGLLCDYKPRIYRSEYTVAGTSRLVVLQLGQVGGV
jgi:hypothetical protein